VGEDGHLNQWEVFVEYLFGLLLIPLLMGGTLFFFFRLTITLKEFLLLELIAVAVATGGFFIARWGALQDTEHWNGRVTQKIHNSQSCCHCRQVCSTCTDSKGRSYSCQCHQVCDHFRDYYWSLAISTGDTVTVENCEPDEDDVPVVWARAKIGEPASVPHLYTNYLRADPDSLLRRTADPRFEALVPVFPEVYEFYKVRKVVQIGIAVPFDWDEGLREINADLGAKKEVDITMLFTREANPEFANAVEARWLYGPKNALIIVVGAPDGETIEWARVVTISRGEEVKIILRDGLPGMTIGNPDAALTFVRKTVEENFHRTSMTEFEYLASAAKPSDGWLIALYVFTLLLTGGLAWYMHHNDVFHEEEYGNISPLRRARRR
jgi:hypothetical protein